MIQFDDFSVYSDDEEMMVRRLSDGLTRGMFAHMGDMDASHYEECPRSEYEALERAERVAERYRDLAAQKIRARYSESEEYAIQRKALAAVLGAAEVMEESEGVSHPETDLLRDGAEALSLTDPEKALEEFAEYNRYAEQCKREARAEAEALTGEIEGMEGLM